VPKDKELDRRSFAEIKKTIRGPAEIKKRYILG
jgi:hypothetical protein